ncbi:hypothetical protein CEXT_785681 [Caerostris extrusa]|uniref:Uncharacterized protein n=1 Tax=Caerostris extrusa TaxID=172846 RepID=A0AAV4MHZ6_CAEEX|nr:hypothetical protein CEXT_785681 [Caerostris extrusa]
MKQKLSVPIASATRQQQKNDERSRPFIVDCIPFCSGISLVPQFVTGRDINNSLLPESVDLLRPNSDAGDVLTPYLFRFIYSELLRPS